MKRHAYWVILAGTTPTAFRALSRETLVPTLRQLQRTQPDVTLRWFERGRVWESPEAARFSRLAPSSDRRRDADWRPGGEHRDPRARFMLTRDEKRARFKARARRARPAMPGSSDHPDQPRGPHKPWRDRRPPKADRRGPSENSRGPETASTGKPPGGHTGHPHGGRKRPPHGRGDRRHRRGGHGPR